MSRFFRPETAFFVLLWLVFLIAFRERGFYDPGSLWHIKVGEITLKSGIPQTDPFSFTLAGHPWVPQQWGSEVLMALGHNVGGLDTLLLAFASGMALVFTLTFRRCLLMPTRETPGTELAGGMGPALAALVVGAYLFVGAFHYYVRPHMFTIALLAWTMMCVIDYERGWCTTRRLVWLIPLYVFWTNMHGGVLGGTMTLGLAVGGWGLLFLASGGREPTVPGHPIRDWPTAFSLVGIVVACLLTPLVNPHGLEMLRIWQRLLASKVLPQIIPEHMPLDPTKPFGLMVVALGVLYLVLLLGTLPRRPRVSWLIPLVWLLLSFKSIRQAPLFAVVAAVAVADMWRFTYWHRYLVKNGDGSLAWNPEDDPGRVAKARAGSLWWAVPALLVAVSFGLQAAHVRVPVVGAGWVRFDPDFVPADLTPAVQEYAASVPPGTPIFNDVNLGGYLIYHAPTLKVFGDDRCELYGDDWLMDYVKVMGSPPEELGVGFEQWRERYGFERAILFSAAKSEDKPKLEQYLLAHPERWREVARGKRVVMFERVR